MAKTWADVVAAPEFQALPAERQESVRQRFFEREVGPKVAPDKLEAIRAKFDARTKGMTAGSVYAERAGYGLDTGTNVQVPLRAEVLDDVQDSDLVVDAAGRRGANVRGQQIPIQSGFDPSTATPIYIARAGGAEAPKPITGKSVSKQVVRGAQSHPIAAPVEPEEGSFATDAPIMRGITGPIANAMLEGGETADRISAADKYFEQEAAKESAITFPVRPIEMSTAGSIADAIRVGKLDPNSLNARTLAIANAYQRAQDAGRKDRPSMATDIGSALSAEVRESRQHDVQGAGLGKRIAYGAGEAIGQLGTLAGVSLISGPLAALTVPAAAAAQSKVAAYADSRAAGMTESEAEQRSDAYGAITAATMAVPGFNILSPSARAELLAAGTFREAVKKTAKGFLGEGAQEGSETLLDDAYDHLAMPSEIARTGQTKTLGQSLGHAGEAALVGGIAGGGINAATAAPSVIHRYWTNKGVNAKLADLLTRKAEDRAFKEGRQPTVVDAREALKEAADSELQEASGPYAETRKRLSEKATKAAIIADLIGDEDTAPAKPQEAPASGLDAAEDLDAALAAEQTGETDAIAAEGLPAQPVAESLPVGSAAGAGGGRDSVAALADGPDGIAGRAAPGVDSGGAESVLPVSGGLPEQDGALSETSLSAQDGEMSGLQEEFGYAPGTARNLREPASWVIRNKQTGEVLMETFDKQKVAKLNTEKYEAVPIVEHLASLSRAPTKVDETQELHTNQVDDSPDLHKPLTDEALDAVIVGEPDLVQTDPADRELVRLEHEAQTVLPAAELEAAAEQATEPAQYAKVLKEKIRASKDRSRKAGGGKAQVTEAGAVEAGGQARGELGRQKEVAPKKVKKLKSITVNRAAIDEETGETLTIKERADHAIKDVDRQIAGLKGLIACLQS